MVMALGNSCRLRASFLVNLFDLAYAAPARVCIASHENCSEMHWTRAACCMQPCLLTCCLHWTDFLRGSLAWAAMLCVLIQPQSPCWRGYSVGCSVRETWGQLLHRRGHSASRA